MGSYTLKKGYDLRIVGDAESTLEKLPTGSEVAVNSHEFPDTQFKLAVKAGDKVKAGTPVLYAKECNAIKLTSPVSGTVKEVVRAERRALREIIISADGQDEFEKFAIIGGDDLLTTPREKILENILAAGLFPAFVQRPFAVVANPEDTPRDIFISAFFTNPLKADINVILDGNEAAFQAGLNALSRLTSGSVHLSYEGGRSDLSQAITNAANVEKHTFNGRHPAGNVGIQAHHIAPVNKGEVIWTLTPAHVIEIGSLFLEGKISNEKIVAVVGESAKEKKHFKVTAGAKLSDILKKQEVGAETRVINGDVLSGITKDLATGYLSYYNTQISLIPEIVDHEFMGWLKPGFGKESTSGTFLSRFFGGGKFSHNTGYHGGVRAFVQTGKYESVFPMDIYPQHLVKSIMYNDLEEQEGLGILEVAPEDFALCDYVCVSKIEAQYLVRKGLNDFRKEG